MKSEVYLQISSLAVIAVFYVIYFGKMLMQRQQGVQTDQIGKGTKPKDLLLVERLMKAATYTIVPVEIVSILGRFQMWNNGLCWLGIGIAFLGVAVFLIAVITMRSSWRAGIPESDKTELVTDGIYRFSRNPAFLGFDLMYIGLLVAYFNIFHLLFVVFAVTMLHLQILQEEAFLADAFGDKYLEYRKHTGRYFGIKK